MVQLAGWRFWLLVEILFSLSFSTNYGRTVWTATARYSQLQAHPGRRKRANEGSEPAKGEPASPLFFNLPYAPSFAWLAP